MIWKHQSLLLAVALAAGAAERDPQQLASETIAGQDPFAFTSAAGRRSIVFQGLEGKSGFNLHSYLIHHDGRFWAMWSSAAVNEEDPDQQVVYSTSLDGHTWTTPQVLAPDPDGLHGPGRWIARGLFLQDGKLTALAAYLESADYGRRGKDVVWKNLRLMYFQWDGGAWRQKGVFAGDCMNNFPCALRVQNGNDLPRPQHGRECRAARQSRETYVEAHGAQERPALPPHGRAYLVRRPGRRHSHDRPRA